MKIAACNFRFETLSELISGNTNGFIQLYPGTLLALRGPTCGFELSDPRQRTANQPGMVFTQRKLRLCSKARMPEEKRLFHSKAPLFVDYYIFPEGFDPKDTALKDKSLHLSIAILSGRHLHPDIKKGADCNTFVKVEVIGCPIDCCYGTTKVCVDNAFNPSWDERFNLGLIHAPSLAVLRISCYNQIKNPVPQNELLCQATLPIDCIRKGYR